MRLTSPTGNRRTASGGFTLLELLIAITLGAIVSAAVYQSFGTAIDANRRISIAASSSQEWRFFVERLRADLNSLAVVRAPLVGTHERLSLELLGDGQSVDAQSAQSSREVHYEHTRREDGGQVRRRTTLDTDDTGDVVVYAGARELAFRYLADGQWSDEAQELPRAVEVTVTGARGERRVVVAVEVEHVEI